MGSKRWKELDVSKKEEYKLKSQRMHEEKQNEYEFKMKNDPEYFAAVLSEKVKKHVGNPYNLFVKDQKDSVAVMEQKSIRGFSKEMSKRWKEMDESKKEEYKLKSQRMKSQIMQEEHEFKMKNGPEYFAAVLSE